MTVTGTTDPNSTVDVDAVNTDIDGAATTASTTADADGAFSLSITPPFGTATLTVVATNPAGATGFAQRTVINDQVPGTKVLDLADEAGDDNGPGHLRVSRRRTTSSRGRTTCRTSRSTTTVRRRSSGCGRRT